jgi:hypothetical protein
MIVGVVLDPDGRPICCEMWPGNTTDVTTLLPVAERLRKRFGISRICRVARSSAAPVVTTRSSASARSARTPRRSQSRRCGSASAARQSIIKVWIAERLEKSVA